MLGSPNPGQSFGRGLSGPQATEVRMDPRGSWAATNLTVHSLNSFLGPSFFRGASGFYSWVASFDVFRFFRVFKPRGRYVDFGRLLADPIMEGTWILVVSWRTTFCNILAASARILFVKCIFRRFSVFLRFQTWERYVDFGRLLANPIMEDNVV